MDTFQLTTPVAFIIFNRPDTTKVVFEEIRRAKPTKLYLISDAAREDRPKEKEKVDETRNYVETHIDWDCEVHKDYARNNLGCKQRVYTGIDGVLQQEETVIVLEDDVVPAPAFFRYCQEMLEHYQNDPGVMMVSGLNLMKQPVIEKQYTFSYYSSIWGWATWKRAWDLYDADIVDWPEIHKSGAFKKIQSGLAYLFLKKNMNSVYTKKKDTWDLQWDYCRYKYHGLGVVPRENLICNIGFDREDATHTTGKSEEDFTYGRMEFPLQFDVPVKRDMAYDKAYIRKYFGVKKVIRFLRGKLSRKA